MKIDTSAIAAPSSNLRVFVHANILQVMNVINKNHTSLTDEYGMYLKCTKLDALTYCVHSDYYIPEQKVTSVTFNPSEERPDESWNAVIHRHPAGCLQFSSVDDEHLNPNFEVSLLYTVEKGIFLASANVESHKSQAFFAIETSEPIMYATEKQLAALLANTVPELV